MTRTRERAALKLHCDLGVLDPGRGAVGPALRSVVVGLTLFDDARSGGTGPLAMGVVPRSVRGDIAQSPVARVAASPSGATSRRLGRSHSSP
jgi:hypothetical protein